MIHVMKKNIFNIMLAFLAAMGLSSCVLHEEPERTADGELGVDPTQVTVNAEINLNVELPGTEEKIFAMPDTVMHRFVVEAYNREREVVNRQVLYSEDLEATVFSLPVTMRLHASQYRIVVWSDYVRVSDPEAQLYYNADSLTPVINNGGYRGNSNAKDSYSGYVDLDLKQYAKEWNARINTEIRLMRPMGRYELVTTDLKAFQHRLEEGSVKGTSFTARIKYAGYLAVGFNCYDRIRKHSLNYMTYTTRLHIPDDAQTLSIGFDYIFIAPDEKLEVPVEIEVVNENSETVSRSIVTLPVIQDMNTVVTGRFLTSTADGGLNIDPGYDGDDVIDLGTINPIR